jgi:hypothetical protein
LPAYVEVLTEDAAQVATTEEDRPGASRPAQTIFLSKVREVAADSRVASALTDRNLAS